jgi:hypothetical protein
MFFGDMIEEMLKDKRKPVNSMYLHEIKLKWGYVEKAVEQQKDAPDNELVVEAMNKFIKALNNKKYCFNPKTENGFKRNEEIFSTLYLDDLITLLINRTGIENHKGIEWGKKKYTSSIKFLPKNFSELEHNPQFRMTESPEELQLIQNIDIQYRISGKRNFFKYQINLPLMTFYTCHSITQKEFIAYDYEAKIAKSMFDTAKTYIVLETLADDFVPQLGNTAIDGVFVLSKKINAEKPIEIDPTVVDLLESHINDAISGSYDITKTITTKGLLEK